MDLDVGPTELVGFVYTLGVLITGMWITGRGTPAVTPYNAGMVLLIGVVWTAYFRWTIAPRIIEINAEDDEEEETEL